MRELDRLNSLFDVSLYALVLLPFAMITIGGGAGLGLELFFAAALPASWWFHHRGLAQAEQAKWWNAAIGVFLLATGAQLALTELSLLEAGIRFVLVLTIIKLFSRLSERDELQIFALSFLGLAAATTVNEDLTFGLLFGLYVLLGTFTLAIFHLRSELAARPRLALRDGAASLNRAYIGVLAGIGALILSASLAIFFVFPRIGLGFFAPQERSGVSVAGFSDDVELGGHGAIRDNPEVVMRVEVLHGTPPAMATLHWRTRTFDHYDGRRWSRTKTDRGRSLWVRDNNADLSRLHGAAGEGARLQIYLEPLGRNLLPVVWPSHSIRLGVTEYVLRWGPRGGHVWRDFYDDLHHSIESEVGIAYILTLAEGRETPGDPGRPPGEEFLQLPELSDRVQTLATEMTQGRDTDEEKASTIEQRLRSEYEYTTDLPPVGTDPIDSFLFETRRGHCEYFATASVLLLRANGIPARLVNGFLGGQWNEVGDYFAVRQGDAHSWAEYWHPERGWTQIDATPASESLTESGPLAAARATWDAMGLTWMKWVIEYDLNAQIQVFTDLARVITPSGVSGVRADEDTPQWRRERVGDWRFALLIAGLATLLFFAFRRTRRRLRRHDSTARTTVTAAAFVGTGMLWAGWFEGFEVAPALLGGGFVGIGVLAALLEKMRQHRPSIAQIFDIVERAARSTGLAREVDEGPGQFLGLIADQRPDLQRELDQFRGRYLAARFGVDEPASDEVNRLRAAAHRISEKIRNT